MKKARIYIAVMLVVAMAIGGTASAANVLHFDDVSQYDWFAEGVAYVYENGLMNGVSDTSFDPYGTATRAMIVTVLYRLMGEPYFDDIRMYANYADVPQGSWYELAVGWAAKEGIAVGVAPESFEPDSAITREQLMAMLYRYLGSPEVTVPEGTDYIASDWAAEAMAWASETTLIYRLEDGANSYLQGSASRAEIANVLHGYLVNEVGGFGR